MKSVPAVDLQILLSNNINNLPTVLQNMSVLYPMRFISAIVNQTTYSLSIFF